jgi:hypothetical protein
MVSDKTTHLSKVSGIFLILFLCFPGVMAQTISFADPDATIHKDVYMFNASGGLLGVYNTTSDGIEIPADTDLIFTLKPQYSNPLEDPTSFLTNIIGWLTTNALSLIILAAMGGLLLRRW